MHLAGAQPDAGPARGHQARARDDQRSLPPERLFREARAAAMLGHPAIVRNFDLGQTRTDVEHCGACGLRCEASGGTPACSAGKCMVRCDSGLDACSTQCVNLLTDPEHCGACDNVCLLNLVCVGGSCVVDL